MSFQGIQTTPHKKLSHQEENGKTHLTKRQKKTNFLFYENMVRLEGQRIHKIIFNY